MAIINASEFALRRAHKNLGKAFEKGNWDEVRHWDGELGAYLNTAFDDESRDTSALVSELENILTTYSRMVDSLPDASDYLSEFPQG